jgi:glycosyltransferase involved in cell wall biosynthesis
MRVLMTTDPIGGVWNYTLELCAALAARGVRVSLAVLGRELSAEQRNQLRRLPQTDLHESQFRLEWMPDPWDDLARAADWLLSLERRCGADIIHLNHLMHADLPWRAPALTVGHSCVLSWWAATQEPGSALPAEWSVYRREVTESLRAARCVVAPTNAMLAELQRFYGPLQRTMVVNNARSRRGFETGPKEQLVLSAGRLWDRAKNIESLAAVAQHLATRVVVAGETLGPHGEVAQAPNLTMLGSLDAPTLAGWYSRAAIYALPARYEPFGLTALEAAHSRCALILGDIPSLREVWGAAARFVPPGDHSYLRDTLNEFLANESLRERFATRAAARARHFTPRRQVHEYLAIYRLLLGEATGAGAGRHRHG